MTDSRTDDINYAAVAALEVVYRWYGAILPEKLDTTKFSRFVARSLELARYVSPDVKMSVRKNVMSAYTDGKLIVIPAVWLLPEFYEFYGIPEEHHAAAATLVVNGVQVHEALHCLLSVFGQREFCVASGIPKAVEYFDRHDGFGRLLNIIEDVFIEEYARWNFPGLSSFVDGKNHVLCGDYALDRALADVYEDTDGPLDVDQRVDLLASFSKTPEMEENPICSDLLGDLLAITAKARNPDLTVRGRTELTIELFEQLVATHLKDEGFQESELYKSPEKHDDEEDEDDTFDRWLEKSISGLLELLSDDELAALMAIIEQFLTEAYEEMDTELSATRPLEADGDKDDSPDVHSDVLTMVINDVLTGRTTGSKSAVPNESWRRFGQYLRYRRQTRSSLGRPLDHGGRVIGGRLHRLATDGRIFGRRDNHREQRGSAELVLVVDASGSMATQGSSRSKSLYQDTVEAAYGMFISLRECGVPVAVYAHTSTERANLRPLLYSVAAFRMPVFGSMPISHGDYDHRFQRMANIPLLENFDGYAIAKVTDEFSTSPGTKAIIVLSDGVPSGGHLYGGEAARIHTRQAIKAARSKGRYVMAVSLVESVVEANDKIYGQENNLKGYGVSLDDCLQQLAERLVLPPDKE